MLSNLKDYSIDHHDRMICDVLPAIVRMEISVLSAYFEARVQPLKSLSIPQLTRGTPRVDRDFDVVSLWPDVDEVQQQVFDETARDDEAIQV